MFHTRVRRHVATVAVGAVAVMALAGCGGNADTGTTPATDGSSAPPADTSGASGEITFWSSIGGMDEVAKTFNESQDDIVVKYEEIPNAANGGYAQLASALDAGTGPDVVGIEYPALPGFVADGSLLPLTDLIGDDVYSGFTDAVVRLVTFDGDRYGMPYDQAPLVVYYREDVLKEAGVEVPTTWDEFATAAKAIRDLGTDQYIASFNPNEPNAFASLNWANGATWLEAGTDSWTVDIDSEKSKQVTDYWQKMIDEDLVKVSAVFGDEWAADLANGTTAGVIGASWSAAGIKTRTEGSDQAGKWTAAMLPSFDGSPTSAHLGGTSFAMTKNSANHEAAAVFLEYVTTNPDAVEARGEIGSANLAYDGLNDVSSKVFDTSYFTGDLYAVYAESAAAVGEDWVWGPNWSVTQTALSDALAKVESGGKLGDVLTTAQKATVSGLSDLGISVSE